MGDCRKCKQKTSDGAFFQEKMTYLDCIMTKNDPEMGLGRLIEFSTMSNGSTGRGDHRQQLHEWYAQTVNIDAQPLRVLIVLSQQPGETGSGVYLRETVHELQKFGHTPYLLAAHCRCLPCHSLVANCGDCTRY